jgi:hypothetical protein
MSISIEAHDRICQDLHQQIRSLIVENEKLRAALEQPEQAEPVAWRTFDGEGGYDYRTYDDNENYRDEWDKRNPNHKGWVEPLYITPPRREWRGLTEEDIWLATKSCGAAYGLQVNSIARAIEAALKEKNNE